MGGNATSPLHSRGSPTKGSKSKWAHKWAEMLHHPCIIGDPQRKGDKARIGCLTRAFWKAHKWAEMLHHPCILGGPQQRGQNQSGPTSGRKCYITPAFSGIPKERGQSQSKKKAKKKNCPMVSLILPTSVHITPTGV